MNIAHIGGKGIGEEIGTQEEYLLQHATYQVRLGHRVFVYTSEEPAFHQFNGINLRFFRSPFRGWLHEVLHILASALHLAFCFRADIIHLHGSLAGLAVPICKIFRPSAIIFLTLHQNELSYACGTVKRLVMSLGEKWGIKSSVEIFCTKQMLVNDLALRYDCQAQFTAPGVSVKRVATDDTVLSPFGLKSYGYVAMVAPLLEDSGVFTLIDAWQKARAERPDIFEDLKLAIVNSEFESDLNLEEHLDDSIVLTGFQNREVLQALYAGARFMVLPSFNSARPALVLTALSYGKAVIASSFGEYSALLRDQAIMFEPGNADELAICLLKLAEDQTLAASLGHSARVFVEDEYCWPILAREMEEEYLKHRALREGLLAIE